jgi:hypothetical protein
MLAVVAQLTPRSKGLGVALHLLMQQKPGSAVSTSNDETPLLNCMDWPPIRANKADGISSAPHFKPHYGEAAQHRHHL